MLLLIYLKHIPLTTFFLEEQSEFYFVMFDLFFSYAEQQAAEAEEEESSVVAVVYRIPTQLVMYTEPSGAVEGSEFSVQPKVQVLDALVSVLFIIIHTKIPMVGSVWPYIRVPA